MGAFQLRHMDRIPPHAALSESVELVRAAGHPKAAGLVNAILRKLSTTPGPRKPIAESIDAMATRLGHPAWLVKRLGELLRKGSGFRDLRIRPARTHTRRVVRPRSDRRRSRRESHRRWLAPHRRTRRGQSSLTRSASGTPAPPPEERRPCSHDGILQPIFWRPTSARNACRQCAGDSKTNCPTARFARSCRTQRNYPQAKATST